MAAFLTPGLFQQLLGTAERFADLEGRTTGECELLLHVAVHRFLLGRPATTSPSPSSAPWPTRSWWRRSARTPRGCHSRIGAAVQDRPARRRAPHGGDRARRGHGGAGRPPGSPRPRPGAHGSRCEQARPPMPRPTLARPTRRRPPPRGSTFQRVLPDRRAGRARRARRGAGDPRRVRRRRTRSHPTAAASCSSPHARTCAPRRGTRSGALADQLESRRLQGDGLAVDPDFDGWLRIARLLHATGDEAAPRGRRRPR